MVEAMLPAAMSLQSQLHTFQPCLESLQREILQEKMSSNQNHEKRRKCMEIIIG